MIPSNLYASLTPEQKHLHQLQVRHELDRLRQWHPQAALKSLKISYRYIFKEP